MGIGPFTGRALRNALIALLTLGALLTSAAPAGAVLAGENGRIVFLSGRDGGDAVSRLYLRGVVSNSTGGGPLTGPIVPAGGQYRHPTWSPDRTRIAFANGTPTGNPTTEMFDIFILDLAATPNTLIPLTDTGDSRSADRPAWSPDGTRIAYEDQPVAASAERNISVKTVGSGVPALALTSGAPLEGKPAWSPDSQTIYYGSGDPAVNANIVSEPANNSGAPTLVIPDSGISEFQPSISPDGTKICFTLGTGFNSTTDVFVSNLANPFATNLSDDNVDGNYNCTWSPDGQLVAYVTGIFSSGALVMERADDTSLSPIGLEDSAGVFDGNPDWAPDGRPACDDRTATTAVNTPVTIALDCTDTGPAYERTSVGEGVANDGNPQNGTLGQLMAGDPTNATYTPNQGFVGTDTFKYISFDEYGFSPDIGTVTITVQAPGGDPDPDPDPDPTPGKCGTKIATITGTVDAELLTGTSGNDVIAALDGNDVVRGGGGNDVICGGSGNDQLLGEGGKDRITGDSGKDQLKGGAGKDRLSGGAGKDRLSGGSKRDRCNGDSGRDRGKGCERTSNIP